MFINRAAELATLETWYRQSQAALAILYGKRRVGKTELIKRFIKDKTAAYYLCDKKKSKDQLKALAELIAHATGQALFARATDWYELAELLRDHLQHKLVLVIDEFPYLTEVERATSSIFQKMWDEYLVDSQVFLILSGSSIAMMEAETLAYKAPLYGRRTGQILLQPLGFEHAQQFFPKLKTQQFMEFYAVLGGVPAYLNKFNQSRSLWTNVKEQILHRDSYLHKEVEFILREEFRNPGNYMAILQAVNGGSRRVSEIASKTGLLATQLSPYLSTLEQLQLLEREIPITESRPAKSKKGLYRISDNFFTFWLSYVLPFKSEIELGQYQRVKQEFDKNFNLLVSRVYEEVARQRVRHDQRFPSLVGRWWDRREEIDIVALDERTGRLVVGEAKWSKQPVDVDLYYRLQEKATGIEWSHTRHSEFVFFSKAGYSARMKALAAESDQLHLFV